MSSPEKQETVAEAEAAENNDENNEVIAEESAKPKMTLQNFKSDNIEFE